MTVPAQQLAKVSFASFVSNILTQQLQLLMVAVAVPEHELLSRC